METRHMSSLHHEASNAAALSAMSSPWHWRFHPRSSRVSLPSLSPSGRRFSRGCVAAASSFFDPGGVCSSCKSSGRKEVRTGKVCSDGGHRDWARRVISTPSEQVDVSLEEKHLEKPAEASSGESFEWKSNWYPVIPEHDLDKTVPHPFQILGQKVVIWYDRNSAAWKTFTDVCPHRLAPLSEGRIDEEGCLQCCYHGWSFGGDGSCTKIPQARVEGPEAKAAGKVGATTFPTSVQQGTLFIWPNENKEAAHQTSPPIIPEVDTENLEKVATFRDLDYGWDTGMENLLDPSHVHVAHHNVNNDPFMNRRYAKPLDTDLTPLTSKGFSGPWNSQGGPPSRIVYEAPSRTSYIFSRNGKVMGTTNTYVTPTAPGKCRIIIENALSRQTKWFVRAMVSGSQWWQLTPRWWDHQKMLNLLDGDEALLHAQERILRGTTNGKVENWTKAFFMPTSADRFVSGFRQWLNRFGGKGVKWVEGVDASLPPLIEKKEDLLDRYESHTKQCLVCRKALDNFRVARTILFILAGLLVGGAPLLNVWSRRIPMVVAAGICTLIAWRIQVEWIPMFYYKGYDHGRNP